MVENLPVEETGQTVVERAKIQRPRLAPGPLQEIQVHDSNREWPALRHAHQARGRFRSKAIAEEALDSVGSEGQRLLRDHGDIAAETDRQSLRQARRAGCDDDSCTM